MKVRSEKHFPAEGKEQSRFPDEGDLLLTHKPPTQ